MIRKLFSLLIFLTTLNFAQLIGPKITTQELSYNFGTITQGQKVNYDFYITNSGGDLLKIENVRASCGCTVAKPDKEQLTPGEGTKIKVTFDSRGKLGPQEKSIYVKSNDPDKPNLTFKLEGVVVKDTSGKKSEIPMAKLYIPELTHDFGKVKEGDVEKYTFKIQNTGADILNIKDIKTSCGCTAALVSDKSLKPGQEGTIRVELDTKNRSGRMVRTVTVFSNDLSAPTKIITVSADVQKKEK